MNSQIFLSKILLFGEYGILKNSKAISIPHNKYQGNLDFGDLTVATGGGGGTSDSVRAVFTGGFLNPGSTNVIDIVTIATTGNAARFGDMYAAQSTADAATSDSHGGLS